MVRHLPTCVRTSIPLFFSLVGNTCCYMALLWKVQINRMATSSIFLVSVKEGAMLQVVKQVLSERQVATLCHCPRPYKNEFELINVEKVKQCYFSGTLNTQVLGFYVKYAVGCTITDSTETEQVGLRLVCRRRWVNISSEALTILTEFFLFRILSRSHKLRHIPNLPLSFQVVKHYPATIRRYAICSVQNAVSYAINKLRRQYSKSTLWRS